MELSEQVGRFLEYQGFGSYDTNTTIFINRSPDKPDESIAIYPGALGVADPKNEYGMASLQLLIRTAPYQSLAVEKKAREIIMALNGFNSDYLVPGGFYIINITALQSSPAGIGADASNRYEFSQNFQIEYMI